MARSRRGKTLQVCASCLAARLADWLAGKRVLELVYHIVHYTSKAPPLPPDRSRTNLPTRGPTNTKQPTRTGTTAGNMHVVVHFSVGSCADRHTHTQCYIIHKTDCININETVGMTMTPMLLIRLLRAVPRVVPSSVRGCEMSETLHAISLSYVPYIRVCGAPATRSDVMVPISYAPLS